ncbi:MAG: trypsin-like serine protease [Lachnospiraceae bacterium]|nr:trypsin-like serine protease [Lachnospiraceae bacterium]
MSYITIEQEEKEMWQTLIKEGLAKEVGVLDHAKLAELPTLGEESEGMYGKVFGPDTRTLVDETKRNIPPYRSIAYLNMMLNGRRYRGTAYFIEENMLLTAGHNIYDKETNQPTEEMWVIQDGNSGAVIRKVGRRFVPPQFIAAATDTGEHDWGLLKVETSFHDAGRITYMKAKDAPDESLTNGLIAGYPKKVNGEITDDMWEAQGAVTYQATNNTLTYQISTSGGNSGSPVMVDLGNEWAAIGIHVIGAVSNNVAKAIDDDIFEIIAKFDKE